MYFSCERGLRYQMGPFTRGIHDKIRDLPRSLHATPFSRSYLDV